jgi:eukaryotic-like serine/threonine-protein kinase
MKTTGSFLLAIILLSLFTACGGEEYMPPTGWQKHVNYTLNFTIHYPPGWKFSNQGNPNLIFNISSPKTSDQDYIEENVNLIVQDVAEGIDAASYLAELEKKASNQLESIEKQSNENVDFKGYPAITSTYLAKVNDIRVRWLQYTWIKDGKAYLLTYSAEIAQYEAYKDFAMEIIKSFQYE